MQKGAARFSVLSTRNCFMSSTLAFIRLTFLSFSFIFVFLSIKGSSIESLGKKGKPFGIVFSSCNDEVKFYSFLFDKFNCTNTAFFFYEKCSNANVYIHEIRNCLQVTFLKKSDGSVGRAHEVYLHHICKKWSELNSITFFLKSKRNPRLYVALRALEPSEVSRISYMNVGAASRRGKSIFGITGKEATYFHSIFQPLIPGSATNILNSYISFQSNFIVSSEKVSQHPIETYEYLYSFVMERNLICAQHVCCTCQGLERFWPILFSCAENYLKFHQIHQIKEAKNVVEPKGCFDANATPVINLQPQRKEFGTEVQKSVIILGVYFASLFRWDVLIPHSVAFPCFGSHGCNTFGRFFEVYDQEHFIDMLKAEVNIEVLLDSSNNYVLIPKHLDPCPRLRCKHDLEEHAKKYLNLKLKGRYLLNAPRLRNLKFSSMIQKRTFQKGIHSIQGILKEKVYP